MIGSLVLSTLGVIAVTDILELGFLHGQFFFLLAPGLDPPSDYVQPKGSMYLYSRHLGLKGVPI